MVQIKDGTNLGESLVKAWFSSSESQILRKHHFRTGGIPRAQAVPGDVGMKTPWLKIPRAYPVHGHRGGKPMDSALANTKPNFIIKNWLEKIGVTDTAMYGSHNLRRGECTVAMLVNESSHHQAPWEMEKRHSVPARTWSTTWSPGWTSHTQSCMEVAAWPALSVLKALPRPRY